MAAAAAAHSVGALWPLTLSGHSLSTTSLLRCVPPSCNMSITRILPAFCVLFSSALANHCLNGGLPVYTRGQLKCQCSSKDFTGERCQFEVTKVRSKRCVYGVYVEDRCLCDKGYMGSNCDFALCGIHGVRSSFNTSKCYCERGYTGDFCEISSSNSSCIHGVYQNGR